MLADFKRIAKATGKTVEEIKAYQAKAEAFDAAHPDFHVPYSFPLILPSEWRSENRGPCDASYRRSNGLLVLCSSTKESDGRHWLHVSLSYPNRLPSYEDLAACKKLFIGKDRIAYQIFPDEKKHINLHPYVLHLWCPVEGSVTPDFTRGLDSI